MSLIQFHRKLKQTIQILKQINLAHSMCGKIELPVLTLTGWEATHLRHKNKTIKIVNKRTKRHSKFNA